MDNEASTSSTENNINSGCVSKSGVLGRGEAVILDSVGQILDVLRTGQLDTNRDEGGQVTNGQTNEPVTAAPNSVDEDVNVNKVINDSSESSDASKKQVLPSQRYDSDTTSSGSDEDEEGPAGGGMMVPRQGVNMQSRLENCENVHVGKKMEISGAMTVNTILNVISPTDERRSGPREQVDTSAQHSPHNRVRNSEVHNTVRNSELHNGMPEDHHCYGSVPQQNAYYNQANAVTPGVAIVSLPPELLLKQQSRCCRCAGKIFTGAMFIIIVPTALFIMYKVLTNTLL